MSDALENPPSFGGSPGEPVPEVEPEDLKTIWQMARDLQARRTGQNVGIGFEVMKAVCKPGANAQAVWYRSSMIWVLNQFAQEQMASWIEEGRFRMLSFERWQPFRWNGSDTLSEKASPSTLKGSFAN